MSWKHFCQIYQVGQDFTRFAFTPFNGKIYNLQLYITKIFITLILKEKLQRKPIYLQQIIVVQSISLMLRGRIFANENHQAMH